MEKRSKIKPFIKVSLITILLFRLGGIGQRGAGNTEGKKKKRELRSRPFEL